MRLDKILVTEDHLVTEAIERDLLCLQIGSSGEHINSDTHNQHWYGDFNCGAKALTSLKGAPKTVEWNFDCNNNNLTSLKHSPTAVGGGYQCYSNKLTSLEGAPEVIPFEFNCSSNELTTLEGAPEMIGTDFHCTDNDLTSLRDIHKIIKKMNGIVFADKNPIKSHVLGLLYIEGCIGVRLDNEKVANLMTKYLIKRDRFTHGVPNHRFVLECQSNLLDADLEEYAQL